MVGLECGKPDSSQKCEYPQESQERPEFRAFLYRKSVVTSSKSLFEQLKSLNLPAGDFAIFGSGPLIVRDIVPASNDLDIICRGQVWEDLQSMGELQYLAEYGLSIVKMLNGRLTFGNRWGIGDFDTDELIDRAELIDGLPFVRLEHVESYKKISKRRKDLQHLQALKSYRRAISQMPQAHS